MLVVGGVGTDRLRARVEQEVARRRWPVATAPADTDVVVVVGRPGPELGAVIEDVWVGVPAPRARVQVVDEHEIVPGLDEAVGTLGDLDAQRALAGRGGSRPTRAASPSVDEDDEQHEHSAHDDHGAEHGTEHGTEHHHHGGDTELPGGLAMADLAEDRDGLALDQLHVPLGPVLPEWPSGLVVDVALQGDVIQDARARFLDVEAGEAVERLPDAARALTSVARVLALAGWSGPAARTRGLRDRVLFGEGDTAHVADELDALRRRVHRSRVLPWVLGSRKSSRGAVLDALEEKFSSVRAALGGGAEHRPTTTDLPALDARLVGAEFAAARLIVAAADPAPQPALAEPTSTEGAS